MPQKLPFLAVNSAARDITAPIASRHPLLRKVACISSENVAAPRAGDTKCCRRAEASTTVQGSCWRCKKRRVKCDLAKTSCRKCVLSGYTCSYDKVVLRWSSRPSVKLPCVYNQSLLGAELPRNRSPLAAQESHALHYFENRLWPLLSTTDNPSTAFMFVALQSTPVRHAACAFAEGHRASHKRGLSSDSLISRRLHCMASIREHLTDYSDNHGALLRLLLAVLLLYFLDGFVDCTQQHASTQFHYKGALAIIDALGGPQAVCLSSYPEASLLLSEFVAADLTEAVLQGRQPYFDATIWKHIESGSVWWEVRHAGTKSLASVFGTMAYICLHWQQQRQLGTSPTTVTMFERALQPSFQTLEGHGVTDLGNVQYSQDACSMLSAQALVRAYQHAALIYLYRVLCDLPTDHLLIQQHVQACLDSVRSIESQPKLHNCTSFPLYVAGAHSLKECQRSGVMRGLELIYTNLKFQSVLCVRSAVQGLWKDPGGQSGTWSETFISFTSAIIVL
ncbi:hypothetical protein NM208_g3844 [Fusarium decemcellulare]|uniref:Uncharacterized protein n=1 Tax=Fusarium decemcellulare TaxID=57161 RepID=A0ACC1SN10_9HYPO|nr:hypothetical protein NM208_g3844 [Fusarium decemcellulare]